MFSNRDIISERVFIYRLQFSNKPFLFFVLDVNRGWWWIWGFILPELRGFIFSRAQINIKISIF